MKAPTNKPTHWDVVPLLALIVNILYGLFFPRGNTQLLVSSLTALIAGWTAQYASKKQTRAIGWILLVIGCTAMVAYADVVGLIAWWVVVWVILNLLGFLWMYIEGETGLSVGIVFAEITSWMFLASILFGSSGGMP